MTPLESVRVKMGHPDYPNNLNEQEWRALVMDRLDAGDRGFGAKLNDLRKRIEELRTEVGALKR